MDFASPEVTLLGVGVLLLATVFAGTLSSRFGLPALIGFLGLGMLAGVEGPGGLEFENYVVSQTVGVVCLVFILFSGGLDTAWRSVRSVAVPALVLATFGVLLSAGITAVATVIILGVGWFPALVLGAIVASTDAAAVFAILRARGLNIDRDVQSLIEFESGSNDPMAIFLVGAALLFITMPEAPFINLLPNFAVQMVMGAAVGGLTGYLLPEILKRSHFRYSGLVYVQSISAALIAYGLSELLQGNGFLGAYVAGLIAGNRKYGSKRAVATFQDGIAWLAQVVMFLTLGLLATPTRVWEVVVPGLAITAILMLVARPISVFICLAPFRRFDWRAKLFISWAGLRGAVPIVLATFPIVAGVPGAFTIFNIVFFVVVLSSLIQGPTLGWMADRLGLGAPPVEPPAAPETVREPAEPPRLA